ncbi:MAG: hypothetical protein ACFE88_08855, partial [Candidatus Hermodarchaeota archaeon]
LEKPSQQILSTIEKQAKEIEEQKEINAHRINIKTEAKNIVQKFESKIKKIKKDEKVDKK